MTPPMPSGKFDVIYADPPWRYNFSQSKSRQIENHYPTMKLDDIKALPVPSADNAVLFLWGTKPKLPEALQVLKAWGFTYREQMIWDKMRIGMGYWFRSQTEYILVGEKGTFRPVEGTQPPSVLCVKRDNKHSKKPAVVYEIIERMYPQGRYLELFSRNERAGWTMWGNEAEQVVPA
jgi:N6-adenosine-specific RNA methylase IME4